jgi:hypothetical protein
VNGRQLGFAIFICCVLAAFFNWKENKQAEDDAARARLKAGIAAAKAADNEVNR